MKKVREVLVHGLVYGQFTRAMWRALSRETQKRTRENAIKLAAARNSDV
jgi:hypothetical protein